MGKLLAGSTVGGKIIETTEGSQAKVNAVKTELETSINQKAPLNHGHTVAKIVGLQEALDSKFNVDNARTDAMDLNNYWTEGKYAVGTGYLNGPVNENLGNIIVYISGEIVTQVGYTTDGKTFVRTGILLLAGLEITGVGWNDWVGASSSGGGSEYIHVGDFRTLEGNSWGLCRLNIENYKKVKIIIRGMAKTVYEGDKAAYNLTLELYNPFGTVDTHMQRNVVQNTQSTRPYLELMSVSSTYDNNLPYQINGEIEIDFTDPGWFTKSRMFLLNNQHTSGASDDQSGRQIITHTNVEGWRTFARTKIPLYVTLRYSSAVTQGTISLYGIPR